MKEKLRKEIIDSKNKLKRLPRAIVKPFDTFSNLSESFPFLLVLSLFVFRHLHIWIHAFLVHTSWYFESFSGSLEIMASLFNIGRGMYYIFLFLLVSTFIYLIGRIKKRDISYESVEEGIFYVMVTPILLGILDFTHLFFDCWSLGPACLHISLPFIFFYIAFQLSCVLKEAWGVQRKYIFFPALLIPIWVKYSFTLKPTIGGILGGIGFRTLFVFITIGPLLGLYFKKGKWKRLGLLSIMLIYGIYLFIG